MLGGFRFWAAVDLMDGQVVRLHGGVPETRWLVSSDPLALALSWQEQGAPGFHVVDLDAALRRGSNAPVVEALCQRLSVPVQVGGGVRSEADFRRLRSLGAARVVVGSLAVRQPEVVAGLAQEDPEGLVVAADVQAGVVTLSGWQEKSTWSLRSFARAARRWGVRHLLVTAVARDGTGEGPDWALLEEALVAFGPGVLASGGVGSRAHLQRLRSLAGAGLEGAVVGAALARGEVAVADLCSEGEG